MAWLDWIIIMSIALLAGAIVGAMRRRGRSLNKPDLQPRKTGSPDSYKKPGLPTALHNARALQYSAEAPITDVLTGLETHGQFREALDRERDRAAQTGRPFSLIVVGLDRFRQVYERMGRLGGDKVLKAVAPLLTARSRHSDVVARYGADEFAILMPGTDAQRAEALAERLRAAVEADRFLRLCEVTASFGVATFPDHGQTPEAILRVAESGMYLAKRSDGNCVKVASPSIAAGDAERDHEWLEAIAKRMFPAGDEPFTHYPQQFEQRKPLLDTIMALAFAVEGKGPYMQGHCQTVSKLAAGIALQAGLPHEEIDNVRLAGFVHDIGKLHVPEHVLRKPTLLTAEEFEVIKGHAAWGAKMLELLDVEAIERSVRHHHERYDGMGYPDGLAGESIPLGARIVAVAESFHNMVSALRYRTARTFKDALAELRRCSGTQFDPQIVKVFFALTEISSHHRGHQ